MACIDGETVLFVAGIGAALTMCDWGISRHAFLFAIENKRFTCPSSSFMRCSCGGIDEGICGKLEALVLDTESRKRAMFSASANVFG